MTDPLDIDACCLIEGNFKGEEDDHFLHPLGDQLDSLRPPGPHLGTDIVEDRNPFPMGNLGQTEIEIGKVDQDDQIRSFPIERLFHSPKGLHDRSQFEKDFCNPHDRKGLRVIEEFHPHPFPSPPLRSQRTGPLDRCDGWLPSGGHHGGLLKLLRRPSESSSISSVRLPLLASSFQLSSILSDDPEGHLQCPLSIPSRDPGTLPIPDALKKSMNLGLQGVDLRNRNLFCDDLGNPVPWIAPSSRKKPFEQGSRWRGPIWEKDPRFPGLLLGDSACRQICATSIFELDPGIGNIRVRRENGNAYGIDLFTFESTKLKRISIS